MIQIKLVNQAVFAKVGQKTKSLKNDSFLTTSASN